MLAIGLINVAFGSLDLAMVAPLGIVQVAAVGLGDIVIVTLLAFALGFVSVFTSRLAHAEGAGKTGDRLLVLVLAFFAACVLVQVAALALVLGLPAALRLAGQPDQVVSFASDYADARIWGLLVTLAMTATLETLKVCGMRNWSVAALAIGVVLNGVFNWLFLYTSVASIFPSPASAVAYATVGAQACIGILGIWALVRGFRRRGETVQVPPKAAILSESLSLVKTGGGVGVRHLNDYASATIRFTIMGNLGVGTLAAATVATRLWMIYCRIPQACVTTSFIFYGYAMKRSPVESESVRAKSFRATAWPTLASAALFVLASPLLARLLGGPDVDVRLAVLLLIAYFAQIFAYVFSAFYGELLTAHQEGGFLLVASSLVTYVISLPLSIVGIYVFESAFIAILAGTLGTLCTAILFTRRYQRIVAAPAISASGHGGS